MFSARLRPGYATAVSFRRPRSRRAPPCAPLRRKRRRQHGTTVVPGHAVGQSAKVIDLPIGEDVAGEGGGHVDQDDPGPVPSSKGEVVDSEDLHRPMPGLEAHGQVVAGCCVPTVLSLGSGAAGNRQPNSFEASLQHLGVRRAHHTVYLLGEGTPGSQSVVRRRKRHIPQHEATQPVSDRDVGHTVHS